MSPEHARLHALWLSRAAREDRLVAFVVLADTVREQPEWHDADLLRCWLHEQLPPYMVPERIFRVDALPRNAAGKLDRKALQAPAPPPEVMRPARPPRSAVEQTMASLFEQVLGAGPVGIDDDFFADLGGHSLAATRLATLVRRTWPVEFPLRLVFEGPTVAQLAAYVDQAGAGGDAAGVITRQQRMP